MFFPPPTPRPSPPLHPSVPSPPSLSFSLLNFCRWNIVSLCIFCIVHILHDYMTTWSVSISLSLQFFLCLLGECHSSCFFTFNCFVSLSLSGRGGRTITFIPLCLSLSAVRYLIRPSSRRFSEAMPVFFNTLCVVSVCSLCDDGDDMDFRMTSWLTDWTEWLYDLAFLSWSWCWVEVELKLSWIEYVPLVVFCLPRSIFISHPLFLFRFGYWTKTIENSEHRPIHS